MVNTLLFFYCRSRRYIAPIFKGDTVNARKKTLKKVLRVCLGAVSLCVFCSSPTKETLQWRSAIELPVSNASFSIANQFQDLFDATKDLKDFSMRGIDSFTVDSVSDPKKRHCVAFSKTNRDTISFTQTQDSLGSKTFQVSLGAIPLTKAGDRSVRMVFGVTGRIPSDRRQTVTNSIALPKVRRLTVDSDPANGRLPVHIVNSTAATIDSVTVALLNALPMPPSQTVGSIAPGAFADAKLNVAGQSIDSTLLIQVTGILKAEGFVAAGSGLDVACSLSSIKASSAIVMDSLLAIADTFTNEYKITDSVNIDYADIAAGFFDYWLNNKSGIDFFVSAEHHDLWTTPACIRKNVTSYTKLSVFANSADSLDYYSGDIIDGERHVEPRQNKRFSRLNLSGNRMFPKWIDSHSVTRVDYIVRTEPWGAWDTVKSSDELVFIIKPRTMNYKQMAGTLVKDFDKTSDTQTVEVPFPWPKANQDSLRGRFILQRAQATVNLNLSMPDSAFLDSLKVRFRVLAAKFPDSVDTTMAFGVIKNDTAYRRNLMITPVVNNFPDSVKIVTHVKVPAGTRIRAINESDIYGKSIGTMVVKAFVDYRMNAYFDWVVVNPFTMDLGADTFTIQEKEVRAFRRMQNRSLAFAIQAINHSNVDIRLYALFASDSLRKRLYVDSLALNQVNALISDTTGKAERVGLVNLLGPQGVLIPRRDSVANNSVALNDSQLQQILSTNKGSMRWVARFLKSSRDSMTNVDSITINSKIRFEGVNNMDSLMTAF